ncbi:nuclear transport factor 2 family protein [Lentzea sp. E54]|uniref:nuclear transport factor 2 family protein n=1 Tax=Lentzea xerophila TaxID=3435883 RepID=UPI003DA480D6
MTAHPNVELLRGIYADLTTTGKYCAEDVVLHPATRSVDASAADVVGRDAVQAWEEGLVKATSDTIVMDVQTIVANDAFGAVLGTLKASFGDTDFSGSFCGLWRFRDGLVVEHWENIYDPALLHSVIADA